MMAVPSAGRMALIGRGALAEAAVIARPIWMGHGIAAATAPSPVTSGRGRRIFNCVTKAGRVRMARLTGAAMGQHIGPERRLEGRSARTAIRSTGTMARPGAAS